MLERATALQMASSLKSKSPRGTTMPRSPMVLRCCMSRSSQRYGSTSCDPILPRVCAT